MNVKSLVAAATALLVSAGVAPALAQTTRTLDISFHDGRVTLVAENVTLREILQEWARKGGSTMTNVEKVSGVPVPRTQFENQPEADVLRTLLREVPGYGASMRGVTEDGASTVQAVYILATRSAAPATTFDTRAAPPLVAAPPPGMNPEATPRSITGSPDDEIPPVRPIMNDGPAVTPNTPASLDPSLRVGPDGTVSSMKPGVIIPVQGVPPGGRGGTPPTGGRGRGGGPGGGG